jgi:hypothetical protein
MACPNGHTGEFVYLQVTEIWCALVVANGPALEITSRFAKSSSIPGVDRLTCCICLAQLPVPSGAVLSFSTSNPPAPIEPREL